MSTCLQMENMKIRMIEIEKKLLVSAEVDQSDLLLIGGAKHQRKPLESSGSETIFKDYPFLCKVKRQRHNCDDLT